MVALAAVAKAQIKTYDFERGLDGFSPMTRITPRTG
jgi:hypothetical protein